MMPIQFESYKNQVKLNNQPQNDTIKGVLLNTHIKNHEKIDDFSQITTQLLITDKIELPQKQEEKKESFNYKKALKPLLIAAGVGLGAIGAISLATRKYSSVLATKQDVVRPGDLARNINILEEPHFAAYRMLRDPSAKNVLGFSGVMLMSIVTLGAKNIVDGAKEIWIKKQKCDIERDLQENLIQVETDSFSGKLNVINNLLSDNANYFKNSLSPKKQINFKGNTQKEENKKDIKPYLILTAGVLGFVGLTYGLFRNFQKTVKNLDTFTKKFEHNEIQSKISNAVQETDKKTAIQKLVDLFKVINAKDETMKTNLSKIQGITSDEIQQAINDVKAAQIYVQAPEALGGIAEKIQYYCYVNEERGHLYNWILNPENKFNKYLFLIFSAISATSYTGKQTADAIKTAIVERENSKSELSLKKRLVEVEVNNFKAKKMSAINPMIENYNKQLKEGKSKEELKQLAENILIEIKNGPPYVYA